MKRRAVCSLIFGNGMERRNRGRNGDKKLLHIENIFTVLHDGEEKNTRLLLLLESFKSVDLCDFLYILYLSCVYCFENCNSNK